MSICKVKSYYRWNNPFYQSRTTCFSREAVLFSFHINIVFIELDYWPVRKPPNKMRFKYEDLSRDHRERDLSFYINEKT